MVCHRLNLHPLDASGKQRFRRTDFQGRRVALHAHRHQRLIGRQVEELFAVTSPVRLEAALRRNLPLESCRRKRFDVHLVGACLVRDVRQPPSVGRERAVVLVGRRADNRIRLGLADQGKGPDVSAGLRIGGAVDEQASVAGPPRRVCREVGLEKKLLGPSAVRIQLVQLRRRLAKGGERDASAVGRPERKHVVRRVERQPGRDATGKIEAPQIESSVAGFGLIVDDARGVG